MKGREKFMNSKREVGSGGGRGRGELVPLDCHRSSFFVFWKGTSGKCGERAGNMRGVKNKPLSPNKKPQGQNKNTKSNNKKH